MGGAPGAGAAHEADLIRRVARSDRAAFEELYHLYHRRLARFLTRLTRRYDVAEDIINDAMYVVWCKAGEFRGDSQPSTWIMGIAYYKALNALRSQARLVYEGSLNTFPLPQTIEGPQGIEELRDWLGHALLQLSDEQRIAVLLCYEIGLSCEEIARIMECPTNTVKTRLFHARAKLQQLLRASSDERVPGPPIARRGDRSKRVR
jgi:RNA polymerase sigma-70 factor (ECF subfamily)